MTNAQINARFLSAIDTETRAEILADIANNYQITAADAYTEVTSEPAEHLLDYVTGLIRPAVSLFMKRT